ncbi:MAG TPA: flavin reductase family protein [Chitinophagales bacterium]|nr:flavin reductase family protein [Chitinophagales bacterium]HNM29633.1 flavin reductase family protein [Chitinophagales bacterium]
MRIDPSELTIPKLHQYILGSVSPRPISFASTVDLEGRPNLAPFSFFTAVGSNPPMVVFSPARSGRDNTTKHTLDNVEATKEVVINIVNYPIVHQMSLASSPYPKGVNEFIKSGLTPIPSEKVKPFRVKESIVSMECIVRDVIHTGDKGGAGNIVMCEIVLMHIDDNILDADGRMDPFKMDLVARMGGEYYARIIPESIFVLPQPKTEVGIGIDSLPEFARNSHVLSGNDLGKLGTLQELPNEEALASAKTYLQAGMTGEDACVVAKQLISEGKTTEALALLVSFSE